MEYNSLYSRRVKGSYFSWDSNLSFFRSLGISYQIIESTKIFNTDEHVVLPQLKSPCPHLVSLLFLEMEFAPIRSQHHCTAQMGEQKQQDPSFPLHQKCPKWLSWLRVLQRHGRDQSFNPLNDLFTPLSSVLYGPQSPLSEFSF